MSLSNNELRMARYDISKKTTKSIDTLLDSWLDKYPNSPWETRHEWEKRRDQVVPLLIREKQIRFELWEEEKEVKTSPKM